MLCHNVRQVQGWRFSQSCAQIWPAIKFEEYQKSVITNSRCELCVLQPTAIGQLAEMQHEITYWSAQHWYQTLRDILQFAMEAKCVLLESGRVDGWLMLVGFFTLMHWRDDSCLSEDALSLFSLCNLQCSFRWSYVIVKSQYLAGVKPYSYLCLQATLQVPVLHPDKHSAEM